jgi:spore maturation protein CgeB
MADDYGRPELGPSFEEMNFRSALEGMGHELIAFDFMARNQAVGQRAMNTELRSAASHSRPDLAFFVLFEEEISQETIRAVGQEGGCPTMNWFADDHWRFEGFSRRYGPAFDWVVTTDHDAVARYRAIGHEGVILSQWACNRYAYRKVTSKLDHDVTFVGQPHGARAATIVRLERAGIRVECWGRGWPAGRLAHDEMVRVFSSSRINLNLSDASPPQRGLRARLGAFVRGIDMGPRRSQIKGRIFEVPGCGGFLLTDRVPYLERYFELGQELAVYDSSDELFEQIEYWLSHEDERAAVADAGYQRVLAEHTYDHRFEAIFAVAGLA